MSDHSGLIGQETAEVEWGDEAQVEAGGDGLEASDGNGYPSNSEGKYDDYEAVDEGDEEDEEDAGDDEYEDEGGAYANESYETPDTREADGFDDQHCPVDEDGGDIVEEYHPGAGEVIQNERPHFRAVLNERLHRNDNIYHPFQNEQEWELATWMHESGLPVSKMDEFFKLKYVSTVT